MPHGLPVLRANAVETPLLSAPGQAQDGPSLPEACLAASR